MEILRWQLQKVVGQCADRDLDHVEMLVRRQASERIALFVHSLGERYRRVGLPSLAFMLPMSREDIANYLGLALETVSRGFSRLQDDGVIAVNARHIEIVDPKALVRLMHHVKSPTSVVTALPVDLRRAA